MRTTAVARARARAEAGIMQRTRRGWRPIGAMNDLRVRLISLCIYCSDLNYNLPPPAARYTRAAAACVAMLIQISVMFSAYQLPTTRVQPLVGRPASIGGRAMPLRMHQAEAPLRRALHTYSAHHTCPCACACAASRERMVRRLTVPRPRPLPRTTTRGSPTPPSTTHGAPPL